VIADDTTSAVFATIGFGDITATTNAARHVTAQMVTDLIVMDSKQESSCARRVAAAVDELV
jgi:hypothetical protein